MQQASTSPRVYSGLALASITVATASAVAAFPAPVLGLLLSVVGVSHALRCRSQLAAEPQPSGWGLSLVAMIISSATFLFTFFGAVAPLVMSALLLAIR